MFIPHIHRRVFQFLNRIRTKILREIIRIPFFRSISELAYQRRIKEYASNLPVISSTDFAIVDALKREGIFVTSLEKLGIPSTSRLLHASQSILPEILTSSMIEKNGFVIHASSAQLMEYPEIFLWGLEERLLNIIENYLGFSIAYHGVYFRRDLANEIQKKTRLWHIDKEDRRMVKIIVYLNDVSEDGAPFQYIPKSLTSSTSRSLKYNNYGAYIEDKAMEEIVPQSEWISCPGSSGTVIFADTASMFHRGKVPVVSDRLSIFFDYTSRIPKHPHACQSSFSGDELLILAKMLDKRQKECVFWNQKLLQEYQRKLGSIIERNNRRINTQSVPAKASVTQLGKI